MRNSFFILAFGLITLSSFQDSGIVLKFNKMLHDFGKIPQGTPVRCDFEYTNVTNAPIVLENVEASCGCTTPEWSKAPVMPGKKGKITAEYNAAADGVFDKTITVTLVGGQKIELKLKGNVFKVSTLDTTENRIEMKF